MKLLTLLFCLLTFNVFADVTGEIVSIDLDNNGNIRVWTQYKIDGVEVESRYPKINGKYVWATRFNALTFAGMTDTQIKQRILKDSTSHTESLTRDTFIEKANQEIFTNHLGGVTNSKITTKEAKIPIDTDGDGVNDKEVTIKTDGTSTISIITP